jgi:hypothetical protein
MRVPAGTRRMTQCRSPDRSSRDRMTTAASRAGEPPRRSACRGSMPRTASCAASSSRCADGLHGHSTISPATLQATKSSAQNSHRTPTVRRGQGRLPGIPTAHRTPRHRAGVRTALACSTSCSRCSNATGTAPRLKASSRSSRGSPAPARAGCRVPARRTRTCRRRATASTTARRQRSRARTPRRPHHARPARAEGAPAAAGRFGRAARTSRSGAAAHAPAHAGRNTRAARAATELNCGTTVALIACGFSQRFSPGSAAVMLSFPPPPCSTRRPALEGQGRHHPWLLQRLRPRVMRVISCPLSRCIGSNAARSAHPMSCPRLQRHQLNHPPGSLTDGPSSNHEGTVRPLARRPRPAGAACGAHRAHARWPAPLAASSSRRSATRAPSSAARARRPGSRAPAFAAAALSTVRRHPASAVACGTAVPPGRRPSRGAPA